MSGRTVPARSAGDAGAEHPPETQRAILAYDSGHPCGRPAALREDVAQLRNLTFVATDLTVEVEVNDGRLMGQIMPPGPGRVEVQTAGGAGTTAEIDAVGCFGICPLPPAAVRLHVRTAEGISVLTAWIVLGDDAGPR